MYLTWELPLIQALCSPANLPVQTPYNPLLGLSSQYQPFWFAGDLLLSLAVRHQCISELEAYVFFVDMGDYLPQDIIQSVQVHTISLASLLSGADHFVYYSLVVLFYQARYRSLSIKSGSILALNAILIWKSCSILQVSVPYMYVMSPMETPSYLLILLRKMDKGNPLYPTIWASMMETLVDLCLYPYPLCLLALPFAFVNVVIKQIADRMKQSGDYIYGVYQVRIPVAYQSIGSAICSDRCSL